MGRCPDAGGEGDGQHVCIQCGQAKLLPWPTERWPNKRPESSYTCNLVQKPESLSLSLPLSIYLFWVGGPNFCRISRKFGPSF